MIQPRRRFRVSPPTPKPEQGNHARAPRRRSIFSSLLEPGPPRARPSRRPGISSCPVCFRFGMLAGFADDQPCTQPMPVIAPALRTFAPELWGEVNKFRHFYATTYTFDERAKRAVSGVEAHFIKYQRLTALAEKLRPN